LDSTSDTDADKARLRRRLRALRRELARGREEASERAAALAPLNMWPIAPIVAGYLAMESEIDPAPLLQRLAAAGARIVLPAVTRLDAPLIFREVGDRDDLVTDLLGLPTPAPSAPALRPTLVITPLLGFDRMGGRLGQGGGFYDRTLRDLRRRGLVTVVGLAFAGQEIDRAPMGPGDERLDAVLTERGYIEFGKG
jgi:5-formyltetrahydrofolate cyclo-ligase